MDRNLVGYQTSFDFVGAGYSARSALHFINQMPIDKPLSTIE